ncbi:MAG: hypothetical protein ABFE07_18780, partial [Armatimonadia bacterium]
MGDRQRLVIGNLTQYGMVEEVDGLDLPANAFQLLMNLAPYKGRLGCAGRWGTMSTATPIFNGTSYTCCGLWELYNSGILKLKAGTFAEYENAAGTMYEIPCWLGIFSTVTKTSGECLGTSYDGNWNTTTFPRACNKWLTKSDKIFLSSLATPTVAKNFKDLGGQKFTINALSVYPTAGAVYHDEDANSFTIGYSDSSGGTKYVYAYSATVVTPHAATGTLTKDSGTGDSPITYTAVTDVVTLKTYADWTDSSTAILQADTTNPAGDPTADCAYNSTTTEGQAYNSTTISSFTNQFFTIRKIKLLALYSKAALIVRDTTSKRGLALEVEETASGTNVYTFDVARGTYQILPFVGFHYTTPNGVEFTCTHVTWYATGGFRMSATASAAPTAAPSTLTRVEEGPGGDPLYYYTATDTAGPPTVTLRLWDGYFDSSDANIGVNASVVWEKTGITDWHDGGTASIDHYEDLWLWWQGNFATFGYGPNAQGVYVIPTANIPATGQMGFSLKNAYLPTASATYYSLYSWPVSKTGPYAISSFTDATKVNITSAPTDGSYLIWASKYANRKKIIPS